MKHQYSIDELKHRENLVQARLEDEQARREELEEHKVQGCPRETAAPPTMPAQSRTRLRLVCEGRQSPGLRNLSFD